MIHVCLTFTLALSQTPPVAPDAPAVPNASAVPATTAVPAATASATTPAERRNTASLTAAIDSLRARYPANMVASSIGNSAGRRAIPLLTLSADPSTAGDRPAILMLAGMDGPRWSGTEAALIAAEARSRCM